MATEREAAASSGCVLYEAVVDKGVKTEELDPAGLVTFDGPKRSRKASHNTQAGSIGECLSWAAAKQAERDLDDGLLSHCWESQWQEFLRTVQSPSSGWSNSQLSGPPLLGPSVTSASVYQGPPTMQEVASGLMPGPREGSAKDNSDTEPVEELDDGDVKGEAVPEEALSAEMHRQRFRWFCYQEADGPREVCAQLREICLKWLQPERNPKEHMVELIVLEQFLAILPEEIQGWVGEGGPETCAQAVALVEEFLLRQQEAERWKQEVLGEFEEVAMSFSREDDDGERHPSREIKQEGATLLAVNGWDSEDEDAPFEVPLERIEPRDPEDNAENQTGPKWEQANKRQNKSSLCQNSNSSETAVHQRIYAGKRRHMCNICGKAFTQKSNLNRHLRTHIGGKKFQCFKCGKSFNWETSYIRHQRFHSGEKPYPCLDCGKSFSRSANLIIHQRIHTGEKPHQCTDCGQSFSQISNLVRHHRVHTGEKPYKCLECEKSFTQKSNLIKHQSVHSGDKPHRRSNCGKRFNQKPNRGRLERIPPGENPCKCFKCGKVFSRRGNLLRHQSIHTKDKPHKC
uniref:Uncharacterized protein n=2 Tax=Varanus komodoensis TaxID=61221 RepID=A0A8D2LCU8_VARKO